MTLFALFWIGLSALAGYVGRDRMLGFWGFFFLSLLFSPILFLIVLFLTVPKRSVQVS
ncbi:MAG TPA: hypothetical protein VMW27_16855 [Thermoanaerobaculia bacterium]|nr:hypothetical protein [Thermoanaerobaculia bacterium]